MLLDRFKRINTVENLLDTAYENWLQYDSTISKTALNSQQGLLHFETDSGWSGIISLPEWFSYVYPKLAILTSQYTSINKQYELFLSNSQAIILPESPLYESLKFGHFRRVNLLDDESNNNDHYFVINTPRGKLWITSLTEQQANYKFNGKSKQHMSLHSVPFYIQLILGQSLVSNELLKRIKVGDIVLIQYTKNLIYIGRRVIGEFQIKSEGIMIDLENLNLDDELEEPISDDVQLPIQGIDYKALVPIKLSFVLDKKEINISDLEMLARGHFLSIDPACYKNIELQANGLPVAKGEMVILDDNIAIEIKTIYGQVEDDDE